MRKILLGTSIFIAINSVYAICANGESTPTCNKSTNQKVITSPHATSSAKASGIPENVLRAMQHSQDDATTQARDFAKNNPQ